MTEFLVTLFRRSIDNTDVPQLIRNGLISPAFKSGDRSLPKNYRPISLTCHLAKVFERVLRPQIIYSWKLLDLWMALNMGVDLAEAH